MPLTRLHPRPTADSCEWRWDELPQTPDSWKQPMLGNSGWAAFFAPDPSVCRYELE
jgi:hypothetical protein